MSHRFLTLILVLLFPAVLRAELPDPRDQHYEFAHRVLVSAMAKDDFLAELEKRKVPYLKKLWREAEERARDGERVTSKGLDFRIFEAGDERRVVVVVMPEAEVVAEAILVGAIFEKGKLSGTVYTLEKGFERVVLAGWAGGAHLNFGEGPEATPEKFRDALLAMVDETDDE